MSKKIVTLSDTSHPFTATVDETPNWERTWHNDPNHNKSDVPIFSDDEVKALESLEGEKSDAFTNSPSKGELALDRGKAVMRAFYGPVGQFDGSPWVVYLITEMPDNYDEIAFNTTYLRNSDGTGTYMTSHLFFTEEHAIDLIDSYRHDWEKMPNIAFYEYELDRM